MTANDILQVLQDSNIPCYLDSHNPDYTVHFDCMNRAFIFDKLILGWTLFELGISGAQGEVTTKEELVTLINNL